MNEADVDDLDRALSSEPLLTPSSGFTARVMEAVRDAASEPPPLPFPWRRFAAGVAVCCVWAASAMALVTRVDWSALRQPASQIAAVGPELGYAALAVVSLGVLRVWRTFARD